MDVVDMKCTRIITCNELCPRRLILQTQSQKQIRKKRKASMNIPGHIRIFNFDSIVIVKRTLGIWLLGCHNSQRC
jgi:hypothetical protein